MEGAGITWLQKSQRTKKEEIILNFLILPIKKLEKRIFSAEKEIKRYERWIEIIIIRRMEAKVKERRSKNKKIKKKIKEVQTKIDRVKEKVKNRRGKVEVKIKKKIERKEKEFMNMNEVMKSIRNGEGYKK